jgi:hypothetical protein
VIQTVQASTFRRTYKYEHRDVSAHLIFHDLPLTWTTCDFRFAPNYTPIRNLLCNENSTPRPVVVSLLPLSLAPVLASTPIRTRAYPQSQEAVRASEPTSHQTTRLPARAGIGKRARNAQRRVLERDREEKKCQRHEPAQGESEIKCPQGNLTIHMLRSVC